VSDSLSLRLGGHVLVRDADDHSVLIDCHNAIHFENMAFALALALADRPNGHIMQMAFGSGASSVSATGDITYLPPNTVGQDAQLYVQTYQKFVDDLSPLNPDPANNFMRINHGAGATYSDLVVTCMLDYNEPPGQPATPDAVDNDGRFIFDEIGLKTYDTTSTTGMLLSHVIFHPVQKALNRRIEVIYTLRIVMS
jgi:hypothetical protein